MAYLLFRGMCIHYFREEEFICLLKSILLSAHVSFGEAAVKYPLNTIYGNVDMLGARFSLLLLVQALPTTNNPFLKGLLVVPTLRCTR